MNINVLCIIPARGGSKGLPGKNTALVAGKPLIAYSIEAAIASGVCTDVVVTTDDEKIASVAKEYGASVPFMRPPELATDRALTEPTLKHALEATEEAFSKKYDIFVFLQPTDIFRSPNWIRQAVELLQNDQNLDSAFCAHISKKNYWLPTQDGDRKWQRVMPEMATYMSRQNPHRRLLYREDTGIVCATRTCWLRKNRRVGDNVELIQVEDFRIGIDIHDAVDLWLAEQVMLKWGMPE